MLSEKMIEKLETKGFSRWTKGSYDRLYINATELGLYVRRYNSGNISSASLDGEKISNRKAGELLSKKTYIDVATGELHSDVEWLAVRAQEIIDEVVSEIEAEETASNNDENEEEETMTTYNVYTDVANLNSEGVEDYEQAVEIAEGFAAQGYSVEIRDAETGEVVWQHLNEKDSAEEMGETLREYYEAILTATTDEEHDAIRQHMGVDTKEYRKIFACVDQVDGIANRVGREVAGALIKKIDFDIDAAVAWEDEHEKLSPELEAFDNLRYFATKAAIDAIRKAGDVIAMRIYLKQYDDAEEYARMVADIAAEKVIKEA